MTKIPNSAIAPFALRMQPELKEKLEQAAAKSGRSLNAELVARLEDSIKEQDRTTVLINDHTAQLLLHTGLINDIHSELETMRARLDEVMRWMPIALGDRS